MALKSAFLDTSVLVAGLIELPANVASAAVMDAVASRRLKRPSTAWHCCLEFFSVVTRLPAEFRLAPDEAAEILRVSVLSLCKVLQLPEKLQSSFFPLAAGERAAGGRIYDAHIARIAIASRAEALITDNVRHFSGLASSGMRVLSSVEAAALL